MRYLFFLLIVSVSSIDISAQDWANLGRYAPDNARLAEEGPVDDRVVFMGDSITEGWGSVASGFLDGRVFVNRGISGQTTPQMLVRFRPDVIELAPEAVVILAGTNDIAGNTGPATFEQILGNIASMAELARAHGISVVLCSVLPAFEYPWRPGLEPAIKIPTLNGMLKAYAEREAFVYVDYFAAMADDRNGLPTRLADDGVHPTAEGYAMMEPLVTDAIRAALEAR